jgi:N-methylhydantoinase A
LDWDALNRLYAELEQQAVSLLKPMGEAGSQLRLQRLADMRYVGQGHQIVAPLPDGQLGPQHLEEIDASFEQVYTQLYGRSLPGAAIEGITWRLTALGQGASFDIAQAHAAPPPGQAALRHHRPVYLPEVEDFVDVPVYNRYAMPVGMQVEGPAIVEERESTLLIGQHGQGRIDAAGNLAVTLTYDDVTAD